MQTKIATMKPQRGPETPTSNNVFLFGIGSRVEIIAPNVPRINGGGSGIKNGSDVSRLCLFDI